LDALDPAQLSLALTGEQSGASISRLGDVEQVRSPFRDDIPRAGVEPSEDDEALETSTESEAIRNKEGLAAALRLLAAAKTRTGSLATRADLNRAIRKFALSPIDAIELEAIAEDEEILDPTVAVDGVAEGSFDGDAVRMFLQETRQHKLLRPEQHKELARAILIGRDAEALLSDVDVTGDIEAKVLQRQAEEGHKAFDSFVTGNVRLAVSIAKQYVNLGMDFADLIQEGLFGLMRAVEKWEPEHGTQFSTYAYYWIMQSITRAIASKSRLIRLPVHAHERLNHIRKAKLQLENRFEREPTYAEIAEHLNISKEQVAALSHWTQQIVSLEAPAAEEGETELGAFIKAREPSPEEQVIERVQRQTLMRLIEENLNDRQAAVVKLRFGLSGLRPLTLEEVGQRYNVTRERIRQIESKALKILHSRINTQARWRSLSD
jgi:RNA polymerase primary sigma factor